MADDEDLPEEDVRDMLKTWGADWKAPASLRTGTLEAARRRGLVGGTQMKFRTLWLSAAAIALFVAGYGIGGRSAGRAEETMNSTQPKTTAETTVPTGGGAQYAFLLFENDAYQAPAGEAAMKERVGEYSGWARGIAETGRFITGEKLSDEGRWCRIDGGALSVGVPAADPGRGVLAGYFVVGAKSFDEALTLANSCPHLKYGGSVEIRRIET